MSNACKANKRMRKIIFAIVFLIIATMSFGQNRTIRGIVKNNITGEAIPKLKISVAGTHNSTLSDEDGNYTLTIPDSINNIKFNDFEYYKVSEIKKQGRNRIDILLSFDGAYVLNLSLEELMNIKVSTVSRYQQKSNIAPALVTVVTKNDIANSGARNLLDIFRHIPGFYFTINQFGLNEIGIRGLKSTNTATLKLLVNGSSINNNVFGEATRIFDDMPVDNIERIEIIRGPSSAVYGSNAMLSVVNIITENESINQFKPKVSYGSFNTLNFSIVSGHNINEDFSYSAYINLLNTNGPKLIIQNDRLTEEFYGLSPEKTDYSNKKTDAYLIE